MSKCRACLKSDRNMIKFDEKYIMYFNILTNLSLELSHDPQHLCKRCFKTLKQFIEFREKCIAANAVFSDIIPKENIKQEHSFDNVSHEIEVKQENEIDDHEAVTPIEFDEYCGEGDNELKYDTNFVYELISKTEGKIEENDKSRDIIRTKRKTKYTKKKATIEENGKSKDIKKTKRKTKYTKNKAPNDEISKSKDIKTVKTKEKSIIFESTSATSLPCGLCTKSLEDNTQLDLHILSTHKQTKSCGICEEKFVDWQELMSHRAKHLPAARHSCHLCPKKFKTALWLEYHFRKNHHTAGEKQTLRCRLCGRGYPTPRRLQFHITETHNIKNKMFICDFCNKLCYSKHLIKAHLLTHMDNNKRYRCDVCGYSSKYRATITGHKMAKHNPDRVYCVKCKKLFASATLRDEHACKWPDGTNVCPVCGKTCHRLKRHMRVHSEGQPFACERCPARYRNSASLAIHMDKHDGVRRHACELCPAKFYFPSVLIKHRRTHTGLKPYVCKICQKGFTGNNNLKVHMKVHGKFLIKKKEESLHEEIQMEKVTPTSG